VRLRRQIAAPHGLFPRSAGLTERAVDPFLSVAYSATFAALGRGLGWFRWLQHGRVQLYVLYIAVTLVALLVWATSFPP
jgi:hydrogenase-4 component B